ncbi:unnamed protein product [Sympodiomycopsis kandeliae]
MNRGTHPRYTFYQSGSSPASNSASTSSTMNTNTTSTGNTGNGIGESNANGNSQANGEEQQHPTVDDLTSPTALRKLVLNYLLHHCYVDAAHAFINGGIDSGTEENGSAQESAVEASSSASGSTHPSSRSQHPLSAPPLSRLDSQMEVESDSQLATAEDPDDTMRGDSGSTTAVDKDEEMRDDDPRPTFSAPEAKRLGPPADEWSSIDLHQVRQRQEIRDHILAGRIRQATELLHEHFPAVLSIESSTPAGEASSSTNAPTPPTRVSETLSSSSNSLSSTSLAPHLLYKSSTSTIPAASGSGSKSQGPASTTAYALPSGPTSLEAEHLSLNLQIQAFIESIRAANAPQTPIQNGNGTFSNGISNGAASNGANGANGANLPSSPVPSHPHIAPLAANAATISRSASPAPSSVSSASSSASYRSGMPPALHSALGSAQLLYAAIQKLKNGPHKDLYRRELESVTAMLAYKDLERSPVRKYLDVKRRKLLADQINSAIMLRSGRPSQPLIDSAVRQTTFVWSQLHNEQVAVPQDHPVYSMRGPPGSSILNIAPYGSTTAWTSAAESERKGKGKVPSTFHLPNFLAEG